MRIRLLGVGILTAAAHSVALFADLIHNVGDERGDLPGSVVLAIFSSACVAFYEMVMRRELPSGSAS